MDFPAAPKREKIDKFISNYCGKILNIEKFKELLTDILTDSNGKSYEISDSQISEWFATFDTNNDNIIDTFEFGALSNNLMNPLINPVSALLVIDVQNDFIDGSLALKNCPAKQEGYDVVPVINDLMDKCKFDVIVYSVDNHPNNHISFFENLSLYKLSKENKPFEEISVFDTVIFEGPPEMSQKLWPAHCVQNTWGSELHNHLRVADNSLYIYKGMDPLIDSYSAFFDNMKRSKTILDEELRKRNVTHVFICGVAFDYCVSFTAIDAVELGYATVVINDATKGTDDSNILHMEEKLKAHNCVLAESCEIPNIINGKDVRIEFANVLISSLKNDRTSPV